MKHIFVVKLGWVLVGEIHPSQDPGTKTIHNAATVRKWGTTKGLGELALKGPRRETLLDPCGDVEIERSAILFSIKCSEENWK